MIILRKATVKRLRAIKQEKTIEFFPGLNIIKGSDNEAGKSSLRIAITKALFQDPTTAREEIIALTSWGSDEPWEVTLEFDTEADSYRITKNFKEKTGELVATGSRQFVAKNKHTIAEKIAQITGTPSEVFFESTACIGQDELLRIIPEGVTPAERQNALGTIGKRLQAKLSGTDGVEVTGILARLYAKTHHKDASGPRRHLQEITERMVHLRSKQLDEDERVRGILEKRRKLSQVSEVLTRTNKELPAKQELLIKNRKILELRKAIAGDKASYDNLRKALELRSKIDRLEEEIQPFSSFAGAEETIKQLAALKSELGYLSQQRDDLQKDIQDLKRQKPARWTLLGGLALTAGGLIGYLAQPYLGTGAVAGLLLAGYWFTSYGSWWKQVTRATHKLDDLAVPIRDNQRQTAEMLQYFGYQGYEEYRARLADYQLKTALKNDSLNRLDTLVAGKEWQQFLDEHADLDIHVSAKQKEIEQLEPFLLEPFALQELEAEVSDLQKQKGELEQEKGGLEKFFEYTEVDKDQLIDIEEELRGLEEEKEFWERRRKVYDMTREVLEEAHKQTLSKAAELLETEVSRYIAMITEGRYSRVKLDESNLSIYTIPVEKEDWVDVTSLSRATQDQFYLCARLALVKLITEGRRPPLLLDDPLVNFHARRVRNTIPLLQEIAKENQILLFTCSDAYDYLGKVISLD